MRGLVVIGYDGTEEARHAIDVAGDVLTARAVVVAHVWQPPDVPTALAVPLATVPPATSDEERARYGAEARQVAAEGADRAANLGLDATPVTREAVAGHAGRVLADVVEEYDADLLVVGRREVSWLEAAIVGSTSRSAARSCKRPVLVVPLALE